MAALLSAPLWAQAPAAPAAVPVASAQLQTEAEVAASAVRAVRDLGEQVVLGRYHVAIERMNPMWKKNRADRVGGMEVLNRQLDAVTRQMTSQGISIISFRPEGSPQVLEVWPGKKTVEIDGRQQEVMTYEKWLVLVPTVTRFRIISEETHKPHVIESIGFQVAVADKTNPTWTFIDGANVSVSDLRALFLTLPEDLELPKLEKREIQ